MAEVGAGNDLAHLLKVLNTSKIVEDRVKALDDIATSSFTSNSDQLGIVAALTACWQEDAGSIIRDCKWRTNICRVACSTFPSSQTEPQIFIQYVQLATKASAWCAKCLSKQAVPEGKSKGARQDVLPKLLAETNALSVATFAAAMECSYLLESPFTTSLALLISSSFSLVKVLCFSSTLRNDLQGAEMHKAGLELLGAALRLVSKVSFNITSTTTSSSTSARDEASEALQMLKSVMGGLQELGTLSARVEWGKLHVTGGKNIAVLNLTWKSCVAMLTQTEGSRTTIASVVDIEYLVKLLISHATYSLRLAAEVWLPRPSSAVTISSVPKDPEFRKHCILVKFFFTNATKLCTFYPKQAIALRRTIIDSILKVSTLLLAHSSGTSLPKHAVELLSEFAVPTAFGLLPSLLSASDVHISLNIQLLQSIGMEYEPSPDVKNLGPGVQEPEKDDFLSLWDEKSQEGFLPSRVALFLHLLQSSRSYRPEVLLELARRLGWVLDSLAEEGVYAALMQIQIFPSSTSDPMTKPEWQLMYLWVLRSLETFVTVASASPEAWMEVQEFLFIYALQPCALCGELLKHLWCFIAKHSEVALVQGHISSLVSLLRSMATAEDSQKQAIERLAQLVCALVQVAPKAGASHLYSLVFHEDPFATLSSSRVVSVLLQEGFSFGLLQETARKPSTVSFLKHCLAAPKQWSENKGGSERTSQDAMWCLVHLLHRSVDNKLIDTKQMQEIKKMTLDAITKESQNSKGGQHFSVRISSPILKICSFFLKQKVHPKTLQNLLEKIQELVKSASHGEAKAMIPALAEFLASLSAYEIPEEESNPASQALWDLYHMVLREQHWALVHAGLASFGYFAEHTPCNELWRFIPSNPGLALDAYESSESGAELFMITLRSYLEKDTVCTSLTVTDTDIDLLHQEAKKQRGSYFQVLQQKEREVPEEKTIVVDLDSMDVDTEPPATAAVKESSLPHEVKTAILMLQEGFSLLSSISPNWLSRSNQNREDWQSIISQLADVNKKLGSL